MDEGRSFRAGGTDGLIFFRPGGKAEAHGLVADLPPIPEQKAHPEREPFVSRNSER